MAEPRAPRIDPTVAGWLVRAAQAVLAVAIVYFVWQSLSGSLERSGFATLEFSFGYLAAAWAVLLVYYLLFVGGLALVLRALGYRPHYRDVLKLSFGANLGKYLPGGIWQVAGKIAMAKRAGVDRHAALVASVIESGVSVAGGALMFLATTFIGAELPPGVPRWSMVVLAAGIVGALHPAIFGRVVRLGMRLLKIEEDVPRLTFTATLGLVAYYCGIWFVAGAAFWLFARSLTPLALPGHVLAIGGAYAAAMIGGLLVLFVPAGLGVREGILLVMLQLTFGPAGAGAAAVISVAARVWSTLLELALSAVAVALPYANPALAGDDEPDEDGS
ncbi:MAG: lysylphosphatidylglycerol synthase domain-containing protein [Coriobacteriia bacterium]|nr:lysylphosphatidylglycerol synthase domain-containing protein [Coriobacteriia bacterium]